jgi:hypothetical protein
LWRLRHNTGNSRALSRWRPADWDNWKYKSN